MSRVMLVGNTMNTMIKFRLPLMLHFIDLGHDVIAVCPKGSPDEARLLESHGILFSEKKYGSRYGLNPWNEFNSFIELLKILKQCKPDLVFAYFLKPIVVVGFCGYIYRQSSYFCMVEGLGVTFSEVKGSWMNHLKRWILRIFLKISLKISFRTFAKLIVLNQHDKQFLVESNLVKSNKVSIVDGIGIDTSYYEYSCPVCDPVRFTIAARLLKEKGLYDFVNAARVVKKLYPQTVFVILGGLDDALGSISEIELNTWVSEGLVYWPGKVADVRPYLRETSVFVLPTHYSEGLPRSIMEAMSMGRPVISSDAPGAATSFRHKISGLIVKISDMNKLSESMVWFIENPEMVLTMGINARNEAVYRYKLDERNRDISNILEI